MQVLAPLAPGQTMMNGSELGDMVGGGSGSALDSVSSSNMAPFLTKLFQIVSAPATDRCIMWTARGDSFVISDPDSFARDILPTYFKHNNIRSFVRQLNTYGFRKRTNISSTDEHLEFFHEKFRRDQPALLMQIKRCHQSKPQISRSSSDVVVPHEMSAVSAVKLLPGGGGDRGGGGVCVGGVCGGGGGVCGGSVGGGSSPPEIDAIKNRVGELKNRLGSLQSEIRDYNTQMEHKVNLLMQILQSSAPQQNAMQLQQAMLSQQRNGGDNRGQSAAYHGNPAGLGMGPGAASMDMLSRREDLFHQYGGHGGGGMAGLGGLSSSLGLGGLGGSLGGVNPASLMGLSGMQKPGEVAGLQVRAGACASQRLDFGSMLTVSTPCTPPAALS